MVWKFESVNMQSSLRAYAHLRVSALQFRQSSDVSRWQFSSDDCRVSCVR